MANERYGTVMHTNQKKREIKITNTFNNNNNKKRKKTKKKKEKLIDER